MINSNFSSWTPWTQPSLPYYLVSTLDPSFDPLRQYIGKPLFTSVLLFREGQATWVFRQSEAADLGRRMLDHLLVPSHRAAFEDRLEKSTDDLLGVLDSTGTHTPTSVSEVLDEIDTVQRAFSAFYQLGAFVEPVQIAGQANINAYLESHGDELEEAVGAPVERLRDAIYSLPALSFAVEISASLGAVARALDEASTGPADVEFLASGPAVAPLVAEHIRRFSWSKNNYERCFLLREEHILGEIEDLGGPHAAAKALERQVLDANEELRSSSELKGEILSRLPRYEAALVSLHDLVGGHLVDLRKRLVMMTNGVLTPLLASLSELTDTDLGRLLLLLPSELRDFGENPKWYEERLARRSEDFLVYQADFGVLDELAQGDTGRFIAMDGPVVAEGEAQVESLLERLATRLNLLDEAPGLAARIKGTVVYSTAEQHPLRGIARIVKDPFTDPIEPGEILVASSTTPDFMPAIHRASAIVTDWGGLTSHAAITARELKKPCLIGTNFASSVFRSGETIEIDFVDGEVKRVGQGDGHAAH